MVLGGLTLPPWPCLALLALLGAERAFEIAWSRRRLRGLRGKPAEGALGWTTMVLVHAALLALPPAEAILLGTRAPPALLAGGIAAALAAQALRYWSVATLGTAWNARAVVDPGERIVASGPYRWIRHPNYLAVLVEFSAIPLAFGAWRSWIALNALHLPLILRRIRAEERALGAVPGYSELMRGKGRFVPRRSRRPGA